jgi:hypothetical protein
MPSPDLNRHETEAECERLREEAERAPDLATAGTWCDVESEGTAYVLTGSGSL